MSTVPDATEFEPIDPFALSHDARLDALVALEKVRSWADAQQQKLLAALASPGERDEHDWTRDEIACAMRWSPVSVNGYLQTAHELVIRLPRTLALLENGTVTMRYALALADAVSDKSDQVTAAVETRVLERAGQQTVAQFRRSVNRAVLALDDTDGPQRHRAAVEDRRVCLRAVADGMAEIWALLPADDAASLMSAVDALAARKTATDHRTCDQRRADALTLLGVSALGVSALGVSALGGRDSSIDLPMQHGRRPTIQVTVSLSTLLGIGQDPGELAGYGPIPADLARRIAADPTGTWRRLVTDPVGRLIDYGCEMYRPPQDLTDFVVARDQTCRFPGCGRPARRCEIDHQVPHSAGGSTSAGNCECLCTKHHHLKHESSWRVVGDPNGTLTWISPTGAKYHDPPGEFPIDHTVGPQSDHDTAA